MTIHEDSSAALTHRILAMLSLQWCLIRGSQAHNHSRKLLFRSPQCLHHSDQVRGHKAPSSAKWNVEPRQHKVRAVSSREGHRLERTRVEQHCKGEHTWQRRENCAGARICHTHQGLLCTKKTADTQKTLTVLVGSGLLKEWILDLGVLN